MRIRLIESDAELAAALTSSLRRAGHTVDDSAPVPTPEPDVVVAGLPARSDATPSQAPRSPIVVLVGGARKDEIERWIEGRPRWVVLAKPVSSATLLAALRDATEPRGSASA